MSTATATELTKLDKEAEETKQYQERWHVERTFAWIGNCKRLLVHFERRITLFLKQVYR